MVVVGASGRGLDRGGRILMVLFVSDPSALICFDGVMSSTATSLVTELSPTERLEVLFGEVAELTGQRNAIDGRLVEIVAEIDRDGLGVHRGPVGAGVGGLEDRGCPRRTPPRSPPSPTGSMSFPAARKACGRAGCRWIRSA